MKEKERMLQGLWYDANFDEELLKERIRAEELTHRFNTCSPADDTERKRLLKELIPNMEENVSIASPLMVDYGYRIRIGAGTFINRNCYLMDGGGITIGRNVFIGPSCGFYTAVHPLLPEERNRGLEKALPIVLGDNVWLGGDVTVLPGVTIGEGAVIGAGSTVTKDIPPYSLALGNPCKVVRRITEEDSIVNDGYTFKENKED